MLLRFVTAGSVDDGKSTLIGRLLHDTRTLSEDQWEALRQTSSARGQIDVDLALLTDGLRAEREQRITIDVAYRHFATPTRRFIVADTPGHEQYTRNMVTGASTSELAVLLVDARKGLTTQTRRHAFLAALLGIRRLVLAVNKMDRVDYSEAVFASISRKFSAFAQNLEVHPPVAIPISALLGDNVVGPSPRMPWYAGPTLLRHLETVPLEAARNLEDFRFPVQMVVRPDQDFRGLAGQVASGRVRPGDPVRIWPGGLETQVRSVLTADGEQPEAVAGDSVVLTLEHELDAPRGTWLTPSDNPLQQADQLDVMLCWLGSRPMTLQGDYLLQHGTRSLRCFPRRITHRLDIDELTEQPAAFLETNDIGRVQLTLSAPLHFDPYRRNRDAGALILVDPADHRTLAAGMICGPAAVEELLSDSGPITREAHEDRNGHRAATVWLTGLSGAGKSTLAQALEKRLFARGVRTMLVDGDSLRSGLCADLDFSAAGRRENVRRAAWLARFAFEHGQIVLCSLISPFQKDRDQARSLFPPGRFFEVHVACSLDVCRQRDPKNLYARALAGEIPEFTGIASPYEEPACPELRLDTERLTVAEAVEKLLDLLDAGGVLKPGS